jgi:hypothetical protein
MGGHRLLIATTCLPPSSVAPMVMTATTIEANPSRHTLHHGHASGGRNGEGCEGETALRTGTTRVR